MKNKLTLVMHIISLLLSLLLALGAQFLFCACGAQEDGSYMRCHWAQLSVVTCGVILLVIFLMILLVRERNIKIGLLMASLPVCVATMLFPGTIIGLCMMNTMHCQAMLRPAAIALGVVLFLLSLMEILMLRKGEKNEA